MLAPRLTKAEIALSAAPHPHSSSSPRIATTSQSSWYGVFSASPCRNASISTRPDRGPGRPDIPEKQGSQGTSASPGRVTTTSSPFDMDADVSFVLVDRQACETPSLLEISWLLSKPFLERRLGARDSRPIESRTTILLSCEGWRATRALRQRCMARSRCRSTRARARPPRRRSRGPRAARARAGRAARTTARG